MSILDDYGDHVDHHLNLLPPEEIFMCFLRQVFEFGAFEIEFLCSIWFEGMDRITDWLQFRCVRVL